MFRKTSNEGYISKLQGIGQKTLVYGEKTLMTEFKLKKGSMLPKHSHPYEQTGYLVKGHIVLSVGEEKYDVGPGDSWAILSGLEHCAEIIEDSIAIEIFSPLREDYLPEE